MKKGPDFTHNPTARHFDELFRTPGRAARLMVKFALPRLVTIAPNELVVEEPRVLLDGSVSTIRKFRTRDARGDYISTVTRLLDKVTLDELPQLDDPSHAVFGYRRLNPRDYRRIYGAVSRIDGGTELFAKHQQIVGPAPYGHFSTFGFRFHADEGAGVMVRMSDNIDDVINDSIPHRITMLSQGALKIAAHELGRKSN